ncbi:MAG: Hsp70 family protein [Pseudomonadales bacterium]|nr:Hsp70 family protein [Pseudomonadales bacterium]
MIGVGIDFGTSNSVAAWYDGKRVRLVPLEAQNTVMPTATHLDRELITKTGDAAVRQYISENQDRVVELTPEVVAKTSMLVEEKNNADPTSEAEVSSQNVYGQSHIDRGMPGRLFRGVKRLLGSDSIKRLMVFDYPFRIVALITPVLVHIRKALQAQLNSVEALDVHFGHPVEFEGLGEYKNDLGKTRLREACAHAGFEKISFYPEPVAATLSYLQEDNTLDSGIVLTIDFGGGTLDLSVVKFNGAEFTVMSTAGLPLGGDHIDQLVFRELIFPLLGKGEIWSRIKDGTLITNGFPFDEFADKLVNWAVTYTLNQSRYRAKVNDCIQYFSQIDHPAAEKFRRLDELITHNYSYLVFQAIKDAKVALSVKESTILEMPELDIEVEFTRVQFEKMMAGMLESIQDIIGDVLDSAGINTSDVDVVIRTGGSSQISAVRALLEIQFPGKVTEHDPFTSVAAGLAIANYHQIQFST